MQVARQGYLERAAELHSARATGTWHAWDARGAVLVDAVFRISFDGSRGSLRMEFGDVDNRRFDPATRRNVVWDDEVIVCTRYWDAIRPHGCESETFDSGHRGWMIATGGLAYQPDRLVMYMAPPSPDAYQIVDEETLGPKHTKITVQRREGRDERQIVTLDTEVGDRPISIAAFSAGMDSPVYEQYCDWAEENGVWYIRRFEWRNWDSSARGYERNVLEFTEFDPNPEVADSEVSLAALEMCDGSRVIDRRTAVKHCP